jgi:hypothetical protein
VTVHEDISPEQRTAEAAGPASRAASAAIQAAGPNTQWSPMGMQPALLDCSTHPHQVRSYDRHGSMHWTACCLVHDARREWHYAHPDDLHVFRVPSRRGLTGDSPDLALVPGVGMVLDVGELGGPPFAVTFVDYLDFSHEAIIRGLREQRRLCASRHATWPDHRGKAVCGSLLWSVIANGNSVEYAADEAELTPERAGELLLRALGTVWAWRSREANGLRMRESA